jgi:hypothetical protein
MLRLKLETHAVPCSVKDCTLSAHIKGRCWSHQAELEALCRAQGKDWGRDQHTTDVRFFYATRKGFHAY